jgi:hypothetical protein
MGTLTHGYTFFPWTQGNPWVPYRLWVPLWINKKYNVKLIDFEHTRRVHLGGRELQDRDSRGPRCGWGRGAEQMVVNFHCRAAELDNMVGEATQECLGVVGAGVVERQHSEVGILAPRDGGDNGGPVLFVNLFRMHVPEFLNCDLCPEDRTVVDNIAISSAGTGVEINASCELPDVSRAVRSTRQLVQMKWG